MSETELLAQRSEPVPLASNLTSVQPGGGFCYRLELAWGRVRRFLLKTFRPGYVRRMAQRRHGSADGAPHEILDPRDLKYARNQCDCDWDVADDRFRWRERIPLARWGLAEVAILGLLPAALLTGVAVAYPQVGYVALAGCLWLGYVCYFFRDPPRRLPAGEGLLVAPADGTVAEITRLEKDEFLGGPAVRIGIFLSIFNVHINRVPSAVRVIELRYSPGLFLNALDPASAIKNENMWIGLEEQAAPHRRLVVRQIAGLIARRIVCNLRPGELLSAGHPFGMIKLGSRTEMIVPDQPDLQIETRIGQKIKAGKTVLARFASQPDD
ncbi:MAG: phosphatidylserine decarboxylase family protein [Planctomycetales bacterium]|nr:phosphatidylserine decarboxylase family protein [Planctomycetales bacterium]NIM09295.1 phosphatidylserine decarboxylase family protein [Planctomycetales bacterium]NIN08763.1 phosphatidylserine decarboxylase family protein [Planctomycetales bacterium]NIN77882.1 phosphatidylserine decarboxylase family protein [Planctomycetales bacterium]NIO35065.1 phosphatidylserine decarboxylase family protein [Planctomycetales bacterium]